LTARELICVSGRLSVMFQICTIL
jgi:hypothetical protein